MNDDPTTYISMLMRDPDVKEFAKRVGNIVHGKDTLGTYRYEVLSDGSKHGAYQRWYSNGTYVEHYYMNGSLTNAPKKIIWIDDNYSHH